MNPKEQFNFQSDRFFIRPIVSADIHSVFKGLSHPDVIKYYGVSYLTLEATNEQMVWYSDLLKNETGIWFAICSLDNKLFFGAVGFSSLNKEHRKAEIGFWLLPEYWRQGIVTEVLPLICDFGFNNLQLHRIEAFVESENWSSKKALDKLNFQLEGTMRECEIKNGKYINLEIYSKINTQL